MKNEVFKCSACAAPLDYEGKTMQKCKHCGSNVVVSSDTVKNSEFFGGKGSLNFSNASDLDGKALSITEIYRNINAGNKIMAIKIFRETFGGSLLEAKNAVDDLADGKSVDVSGMSVQTFGAQPIAFNSKAIKRAGFALGGTFLTAMILSGIVAAILIGAFVYVLFIKVDGSIPENMFAPGDVRHQQTESSSFADEILKFGGEGNGAGKFKDNRLVAVDGQGRIYSADYNGGKIQAFDAGGKYLHQWTADKTMNLYGLIADRKGTVFVSNNKGLYAFQGEGGKLLNKFENSKLRGIALMPDGKIAAVIGKGFAVFDADLKKIREFATANEAANSSFGFKEIAADGDGTIFMVSATENYVCKFNSDGKFLDRFKVEGSPNGIAIDHKGRVFVSNTSNIDIYDAEGKSLESFRTDQAFGIVFNDAGELFVASRPFVVKYRVNF